MNTETVKADNEDIDILLDRAGSIIKNGGLVAFPTETVYGLGGDAFNPSSSKKIYAAKGRPSDNPLIVHIADIEDLDRLAADIPPCAEEIMERFWPGPLTLIFKKKPEVPDETTGGLDTVAVRFPSDETAQAFIKKAGGYIAAPSANLSGKPSPTSAKRVFEDMDGRIEMIIDGGDCEIGLESTILDLTGDAPVILRPGYITAEDVSRVLKDVEYDPAMGENSTARPKAPGMKYRHYAPNGEMLLVAGDKNKVYKYISDEVRSSLEANKKTAIICTDDHSSEYAGLFGDDTGLSVKSLGPEGDPKEAAHRLFSVLRDLDEEGSEMIYAEAFGEEGLYKAITNRMKKAAGGNIIKL